MNLNLIKILIVLVVLVYTANIVTAARMMDTSIEKTRYRQHKPQQQKKIKKIMLVASIILHTVGAFLMLLYFVLPIFLLTIIGLVFILLGLIMLLFGLFVEK